MADVRIPPQTAVAAQLGRVQPPAKSEAVRAAQRAFFEAAMGQAQTPAPSPAATTASASPAASARSASNPAHSSEPDRFARPGSVLDIKV